MLCLGRFRFESVRGGFTKLFMHGKRVAVGAASFVAAGKLYGQVGLAKGRVQRLCFRAKLFLSVGVRVRRVIHQYEDPSSISSSKTFRLDGRRLVAFLAGREVDAHGAVVVTSNAIMAQRLLRVETDTVLQRFVRSFRWLRLVHPSM